MNDVEYERVVDARVQRILATDPAYRYAESAEEQAAIEEQVTEAVERALAREQEHTPGCGRRDDHDAPRECAAD